MSHDVPATEIAARDLLALIQLGKAPRIIDVRSQQEFDQGHVPGATLIPFWKLLAGSQSPPASPLDTIVVYCGHGPRAYLAGAALRRRGFERIVYLKGHMSSWRRQELPVEKP
jgi:rhodanese-related sulfurtransferase